MGSPGTSPFGLLEPEAPVVPPAPRVRPRPRRQSNAPHSRSRQHPPINLYIETAPNSGEFILDERFDWRDITLGMDGGDTTATIVAGLDAGKLTGPGAIGDEHLSHLLDRINPDLRVEIIQRRGRDIFGGDIFFSGYPQIPSINWTERGQSISCLCLSEGQEILRTSRDAQVYARNMRLDPRAEWSPDNPDHVPVTSLLPIFNAEGLPNRSAQAYPFATDSGMFSIHLFEEDNAAGAEYWSCADALRYLAFFHVLWSGLAVSVTDFLYDTNDLVGLDPSPESLDPFVRRMAARVEDVSVGSMSVEEAIHQLTDITGLHYEIEIRNAGRWFLLAAEHYLRVFATLATSDDAAATPIRNMGAPKACDTPREAPFTDMSGRSDYAIAITNRMTQATLTFDRRAINAPVVLGGHGEYEVTLLLRPGWLPHPQLDDLTEEGAQNAAVAFWQNEFIPELEDGDTRVPRSLYHGAHPEHWRRTETGRYWIFPDDEYYINADGTSDWERQNWPAELYSPYDPNNPAGLVLVRSDIGGGIAHAGPDLPYWVPRRRLFRELIGRVRDTGDRAPIVRINFKATDPYTALQSDGWVPYGGRALIDESRAGIYFTEQNLWDAHTLRVDPDVKPEGNLNDPGTWNMLTAVIVGHFMVAVTCVIRGDARMSHRPLPSGASFSRLRSQVIDLGFDRFRYRNRRGQNSHLNDHENDPDPEYEDRDDSERFIAHAESEAEVMVNDVVSGSLETFWIDPTYKIGDSFSGISELGIYFNRYPTIVRKQYVKDPDAGYRTVLHLSDLRHSPEVGSE